MGSGRLNEKAMLRKGVPDVAVAAVVGSTIKRRDAVFVLRKGVKTAVEEKPNGVRVVRVDGPEEGGGK